jgi:guanylate kinase
VRKGLLLVVSGPSGAGKSTLLRELLRKEPCLRFSVSMTTRPPRPGEVPGRDYYFVSRAEFEEARRAGELLEWATVHSHLYGTPRGPVEEQRAAGYDVLLDIDVQGARQVKEKLPEAYLVFIAPPSLAELERRLRERKTDPEEQITERLHTARQELSCQDEFDEVVVNDQLERAVEEMQGILERQRVRREER